MGAVCVFGNKNTNNNVQEFAFGVEADHSLLLSQMCLLRTRPICLEIDFKASNLIKGLYLSLCRFGENIINTNHMKRSHCE